METAWFDIKNTPAGEKKRPPLKENIETDVVIIGGGLVGTISAYLLSNTGKRVVVLEKDHLYHGATAFTTAFITYVIDTPLDQLVKMFGGKKAKKIWSSGREAIERYEKIIKKENIDCEFKRCPEYLYAETDKEFEEIRNELSQAQKFGFPVDWCSRENAKNTEKLPFKNSGFGIIPDQAKFHPLKFMLGLRESAEKNGAIFFDESEAKSIEEENGNDPSALSAPSDHVPLSYIVKTDTGSVVAPHVIISTHDPFHHPKELFAHKGPYTSYVIEIEPTDDPENIISNLKEGLYLDKKNPYHYFRVDQNEGTGKKRIILGGEDHRDEIAMDKEKIWNILEDYLKDLFGEIKYKIIHKWNGPILEPIDGLPYIGRFSKKLRGQMVAMGFSGNGMTYSMIAAEIFRDMILNRENGWKELYDPRRIPTFYQLWQKGKDYVGEFFGGAVKNIFMKK